MAPWAPITIEGNDGTECYSSWSFDVMTAAFLSDIYGDDVKITHQVGHFWMRPIFEIADACFPNDLALLQTKWSDYFIVARGGLFKQRVVSTNLFDDGNATHPLNGRDYSDAGFLKTWERVWHNPGPQSTASTYGEGQLVGVFGDTKRAAYNTPATSSGSQPLFNVPAIVTDQQFAVIGNESCIDGPSFTRYVGPSWKKVPISSRRTIRMHEDDSLTWNVDWTSMSQSSSLCGVGAGAPIPCAMQIIPQLKIKVQYG